MDSRFEDAKRNYFPKLEDNCKRRMETGSEVYGDNSFSNPLRKTLVEIQEELEDVRNWAAIAWMKVEKLREILYDLSEGE